MLFVAIKYKNHITCSQSFNLNKTCTSKLNLKLECVYKKQCHAIVILLPYSAKFS